MQEMRPEISELKGCFGGPGQGDATPATPPTFRPEPRGSARICGTPIVQHVFCTRGEQPRVVDLNHTTPPRRISTSTTDFTSPHKMPSGTPRSPWVAQQSKAHNPSKFGPIGLSWLPRTLHRTPPPPPLPAPTRIGLRRDGGQVTGAIASTFPPVSYACRMRTHSALRVFQASRTTAAAVLSKEAT